MEREAITTIENGETSANAQQGVRPSGGTRGGRKAGMPNFTGPEVDSIREMVLRDSPATQEEWDFLAGKYNMWAAAHGFPHRCSNSLRIKSERIARSARVEKQMELLGNSASAEDLTNKRAHPLSTANAGSVSDPADGPNPFILPKPKDRELRPSKRAHSVGCNSVEPPAPGPLPSHVVADGSLNSFAVMLEARFLRLEARVAVVDERLKAQSLTCGATAVRELCETLRSLRELFGTTHSSCVDVENLILAQIKSLQTS
mmetsp:Transcript_12271/g.33107  ORF Transcript_12271/g.33107 Transcript_12271/m.33107 type:complete len:259 (+) Transcript_12271:232-1008(+)